MTTAMTAAAWRRRDIRPRERLVLLALAEFSGHGGDEYAASVQVDTLSQLTGHSRRRVAQIIGDLVAQGVVGRTADGRGYRLLP